MPNIKCKISDDEFVCFVSESQSIRQVLIKCGLAPLGGNYRTCKARIARLHCDTSHFTGMASNKGRVFNDLRTPISDYLSNKNTISSNSLRIKLIDCKLKEHRCEKCRNELWNNLPIPLELHHIDGNVQNNNLSNLILLCPNCHAQTSNYRGKNQVRKKLRSVLPL